MEAHLNFKFGGNMPLAPVTEDPRLKTERVKVQGHMGQMKLKGSMKESNKLIYFFFPPITQSCSVSDVLFTGGRGVSDFSVLKYY